MAGKPIVEVPRFNPDAFVLARKRRRLSRDDLGRPLNITRQTILRWEKGLAQPPARTLRAAAHVLMIRPSELLHAPDGEPTLGDLRMNRVLTIAELAAISAMNPERLTLWETTGRLGTRDEHSLLLAALLGLSHDTVDHYVHSGHIPEAITHRLARVLHVQPVQIQAAFDRTAAIHDATPRGASCPPC